MPWILRNKKKGFLLVITLISFAGFFTQLWPLSVIITLFIIYYILNKLTIRFSKEDVSFLHNRFEIRDIDTLVIGDTCKKNNLHIIIDKDKTLYFQSPDRSIEASYQIFMHFESVLESCMTQRRLILINDSKTDNHKISIFELPLLHFITKKELKLEALEHKQKNPLFYEPIRSIKILLRKSKKGYKIASCPHEKISVFCKERDIELIYLEK